MTASVYQMMRGAEMLFAALFAVTFLGRRLNKYHLGGIACCVVGEGEGCLVAPLGRHHVLRGGVLIALMAQVSTCLPYWCGMRPRKLSRKGVCHLSVASFIVFQVRGVAFAWHL